jgi:thiamine biosynthesis lipoprotein
MNISRRLRTVFGTFVEVGATECDGAIDTAFEEMQRIHDLLSFQAPNSELSRLNRHAGQWIEVAEHTIRVLRLARAMMNASHGLFDCTLGSVLVHRGVLPAHVESPHGATGSASDIQISRGAVRLARPIQITLDGIAKGYAVDVAVRTLRRCGVENGWVNAGGDMRVFGSITLPISRRDPSGTITALGGLHNAAIATSACSSHDSSRFPGHITNARGERPNDGVWTVIANEAWRADALTKVAALASDVTRPELLRRLGGRLIEQVAQP